MRLNKNIPLPLYAQLAEQIKEQIKAEALKPGDQLPSERDLGERAAISRMTVRQAVAYLVKEGILEVKHGVGTFVAEPKLTHDLVHLLSFTEAIIRQGSTTTSQVLEQQAVTPSLGIAEALALDANEMCLKIVRLRKSGQVPLLLETTFIPSRLCPGLEDEDLATQSLYTLLEAQYGLHLQRTRQTLEATVSTDYESQLFGIEPGTAMILLEGVTFNNQERPIEYFKAVYRGDRFKFALESQRDASEEIAGTPRISILFQ
jgi:GntR family transcriptional regulator